MQSSGPISCLHSFDEAQDYIFDVAWCPTHPAIFGSVDSSGRFDLYNLAISEVPIATEVVPNKKALNKLGWDKEGRHVGLASIDGSLSVYDTGKVSGFAIASCLAIAMLLVCRDALVILC